LNRLRLPLLVITILILQQSLLLGFRIHGVHPDLMLLIPIAVGLVAGPQSGALVGFAVGLVADLFVGTPFGLSAFAYGFVGLAVGLLENAPIRSNWWLPIMTAVVASAGGVILFAAAGTAVGQSQMLHHGLAWIVGVVALVNGALVGVMLKVVDWSMSVKPAKTPFL